LPALGRLRFGARARSGFDVDRCWLSFSRVSGIVVQGDMANDATRPSGRTLMDGVAHVNRRRVGDLLGAHFVHRVAAFHLSLAHLMSGMR
jgi:hypothetical protein